MFCVLLTALPTLATRYYIKIFGRDFRPSFLRTMNEVSYRVTY